MASHVTLIVFYKESLWKPDWPGAHPTNDISIEFEIRTKLAVLWFKTHWTDPNEI